MFSPRLTRLYFALEALNSLATTYFFYYIYFFTEAQFGFSAKQNLALAALLGLCYGLSSLIGGRLAQRRGYLFALKLGLAIMCVAIALGAVSPPVAAQIGLMFVANFGMALTWPPLEALVSEGRSGTELQRNIGIYNIVWAAFGALAYFSGGALIRAMGFRAMFVVPVAVQVIQIALVLVAERAAKPYSSHAAPAPADLLDDEAERARSPVAPATFLKMAWLANPFAYLAINTVVAILPAVALRLDLPLMWAGFAGSIWQFVRTASFAWLWIWNGWHYRFRWLAAAYVGMSASFIAILLAPSVAVLAIAEVVFGIALGLIYYSSLYYSMHVGETKGEHGGVHEAMIGVGCCAGPAVGALSLHFLPHISSSGTLSVGGLLLCGFGGLLWLRFARR